MPRYNLDKLSEKTNYTKADYRRSQAWFAEQAKKLGHMSSMPSIMSTPGRQKATFIPGRMYMYGYYPVGVKELPYYDAYPLVIPFSSDETTFTGLNFHYLPYKVRYVLLRNMLDFATDKKMDEKTKLKFTWQFIKGVSRYRGVESAVKRYRYDRVQTHFLEIPSHQWFLSLLLPMERFRTGPNQTYMNKEFVWQNSMAYL